MLIDQQLYKQSCFDKYAAFTKVGFFLQNNAYNIKPCSANEKLIQYERYILD